MGTAMNIEEYKKLPLEQLRDEYGNCLIKQKYREATVNTSRTDAFYVDRVLRHYRDQDGFAEFKNEELKDYARFKELLIQFREFYGLQEYDLKQIDKYIWQLGKDYFPKNYGK